MMDIKEKPVYVIGYPGAVVQFYPEAASELGVNMKMEYHGCVIETLYSDDHGLLIPDVAVESLRLKEENSMA